MKAKALQFGKAISAALFVLLLSVAGMKNALAQTQVATLQHGDNISVFYGQNAFVDAHTAAETGDIITLSSGSFTPCDITKAITLRGAGCAIDTVTGVYPTIIPNNIQMNVTDETTSLYVEGIYFSGTVNCGNLNHPKFIKCNIRDWAYSYNINNASMQNAQFLNCKFLTCDFNHATNTTLINCVISSAHGLADVSRTMTAYNCFLRLYVSAYALNAYNCIISQDFSGYNVLEQNSVAYNCIGIRIPGYGHPIFYGIPTYNCVNSSYESVFEDFNPGDYSVVSFDEPLNLKEEFVTGFLGNDGTQVSIHGGLMPYTSRPSYMVIDHCNVANRSTIDGKLSVEIEVSTQGE